MEKCEGERKKNLEQSEMWQLFIYGNFGRNGNNSEKIDEDERKKESIWRWLENH